MQYKLLMAIPICHMMLQMSAASTRGKQQTNIKVKLHFLQPSSHALLQLTCIQRQQVVVRHIALLHRHPLTQK